MTVVRRPNRTLGGPHDEFWAACENEELRLQRCRACGGLSWPAVSECEMCESPDLAWETMSGYGRVVSSTVFEQKFYPELPVPWDTILVELDEGPMFVSNPDGFHSADASLNMPVQVTFVECEDDAGAFKLPVFKPRG